MEEMSEDTRTYELSYLVTPTTPEADLETVVSGLKAEIEKAGGAVIAEGNPDFIDLAYVIEKNVASKKMKWSQGYFGWIKFTAEPEAMAVLKKAFDANLAIMRYMLIKTHAENVVTFKKPKLEARRAEDVTGEDPTADLLADVAEEETEDTLEVHETLPDLEAEVAETVASESAPEEKEEA
ncbi:MAG TPA: 30S ribosomal protein S6 [Candidatus Paceibacterota bacterium]